MIARLNDLSKEHAGAHHDRPAVFGRICRPASAFKVGARSLRGIFEEMMTPVI